jgi:hypothetical protein
VGQILADDVADLTRERPIGFTRERANAVALRPR